MEIAREPKIPEGEDKKGPLHSRGLRGGAPRARGVEISDCHRIVIKKAARQAPTSWAATGPFRTRSSQCGTTFPCFPTLHLSTEGRSGACRAENTQNNHRAKGNHKVRERKKKKNIGVEAGKASHLYILEGKLILILLVLVVVEAPQHP